MAAVSTGTLPTPETVQAKVTEAYEKFRAVADGENADYIPALASVPSEHFSICVAGVRGVVIEAGDSAVEFSIQSVSKPFMFALVCQAIGEDSAREKLGANSTGLPFNSVLAVERSADGTTNPMVNAGAIAASSLAPGANAEEKWKFIREGMSRFAGRELSLNQEVYDSEAAANQRNRGIASLLESYDRIYFDPVEATDVYTKQCSLNVTARDLAVMSATLANGGVNPLTREKVIDPIHCQHVLAVMVTAGLYENSGDWLYETGLPGKSGVSGGHHHRGSRQRRAGCFSPPLDAAGNSVRGQLAARFLSDELGLNLFASQSHRP